ncbi:YhgE/Pip domain-containing protein [Pseudogracilibacillus sp. SE30717A]|uniref:YhgE/Pip domain-containing protein n=1 Tax=Pseudogracilibacillus sp. SE30717A TaxID=3098293 RepID=UPI00300E4219
MKRLKKIVLVLVALLLVAPSFLNIAFANESSAAATEGNGEMSTKDEVVYATLTAHGDSANVYVVNTFDIKKAGKIIDYGSYSGVKNLTDVSELEQKGNRIEFSADKGKFYYQGNMDTESLPWDVSVAYYLDGKEIEPEELAGKDGTVQIQIKTAENKEVDLGFFENYLLQISLTLDAERFSNIKAEDGMIANAGKNKQVTFTVMPESEEKLVLEANVVDFELDGIDITGVPSTMNIDEPDVDDMKSEMKTLTGAIADINDGVGELKNGVSELNNGVVELKDGSLQYKNGIAELNESSSDLIDGSNEIDQALETMSQALGTADDIDLSDLGELTEGLSQLASGLRETGEGLTTLKENYAKAYDALDGAIGKIPSEQIKEADITALYQSGADKKVVDKLINTYAAAQEVKGTYAQVEAGFDAVNTTLETIADSLDEMAGNVDTVVTGFSSLDDMDGLQQLKEGLELLSSNYNTFHSGLVEYTKGVGQLSTSYQDLHQGIGKIAEGTGELETGVDELHDGTTKLQDSTKDLPKQMTEEIDEMIAEYDKSDFEAESFVSPENGKVNSVQFVIKTESIKKEEPETTEAPKEQEKGFWEKFKDLFIKE